MPSGEAADIRTAGCPPSSVSATVVAACSTGAGSFSRPPSVRMAAAASMSVLRILELGGANWPQRSERTAMMASKLERQAFTSAR
ncbi:hypothetical protein D3C78_1448170 [compost metagenome]